MGSCNFRFYKLLQFIPFHKQHGCIEVAYHRSVFWKNIQLYFWHMFFVLCSISLYLYNLDLYSTDDLKAWAYPLPRRNCRISTNTSRSLYAVLGYFKNHVSVLSSINRNWFYISNKKIWSLGTLSYGIKSYKTHADLQGRKNQFIVYISRLTSAGLIRQLRTLCWIGITLFLLPIFAIDDLLTAVRM